MSNKKKSAHKREIGVSYTDREGRRRYVYRSDFKIVEDYLDRAENIIMFAKNPRTLWSRAKRRNILISSKPTMTRTKKKGVKTTTKNIPLYHRPNKNKDGQFYLIPETYNDEARSFGDKV